MEIYERIWYLRKMIFKMSRDEFANELGVSSGVITNIELNRLSRPEQKQPLYKLICKVFNINYEWLTTGQGEMYSSKNDNFINELVEKYHLSDMGRKVIEAYLDLSVDKREKLDNLIQLLYNNIKEKEKDDNTIMDKSIEAYLKKYPNDKDMESAYLVANNSYDKYLESLSTEELEEEYKKRVLENASEQSLSASNTTKKRKTSE